MATNTVPQTPTADLVLVTPDMAKRWLELNFKNRKLRERDVLRYARDMTAGDWSLTGEAVKFDTNGYLIDGQHRLSAVVLADVPVRLFVVRGVDPDAQAVIDTGVRRTAGDALGLLGLSNPTLTAAAVRLAINWRAGAFHTATQDFQPQRTHSEIIDFIGEHPDIVKIADETSPWRRRIAMKGSVLVFTYWAVSHIDLATAYAFFDDLAEMRTTGHGDPKYALLRRLSTIRQNREKVSAVSESFYVFRAWNAHRSGETIGNLKTGNAHGPFSFPEPR